MKTSLNDTLILSVFLIIWCVIHSALISNRVISFLKDKLGNNIIYYRIFYNIFSILTLVPLLIYASLLRGDYLFEWTGYFQIPRLLAILSSLYLFYAGGKHYDGLQFLGIRQIKEKSHNKSLSETGDLDMTGILGVIRHPWYTGAILIIWTRNLDVSALIVNVILTLYLIIGTYLEEKKLVVEFGERYRQYQQNVSMLFPIRWIRKNLIRDA